MLCQKACNEILYPISISTGNKICKQVLPRVLPHHATDVIYINRTIPGDPEIGYTNVYWKTVMHLMDLMHHIYKASNNNN